MPIARGFLVMVSLVLCLALLPTASLAQPAAGEGGGGGGGGGGGVGGGSGTESGGGDPFGTMGAGTYVYEWLPESQVVLREDLRSFYADLKARGIGRYSAKTVPGSIEEVRVTWLVRSFLEFIPDSTGSADDEEQGPDEETMRREREAQREADQAQREAEQAQREAEQAQREAEQAQREAEQAQREAERNAPAPEPETADATPTDIQDTLNNAVPPSKEQMDAYREQMSDEDRRVADQLARAGSGEPVSAERMNEILSNVPEDMRDGVRAMAENNAGLRYNERAMLDFVKDINRTDNYINSTEGDRNQAIETALTDMDKAGQGAQTVMSFIPGIGWGWSVVLDGARGGANAYRDGKSGREIVSDIVTNAGTSYVTNRVNGGDAFSRSKSVSGEFGAIFSGQKEAVMGYGRQLSGFVAGKMVSNGLENQKKGVRYERAPAPTSSTPTFDIQPTSVTKPGGQKVMY